MFLGIYGDQFPLYFPECVAHFPLSGNDQIVVVSKLKLSGASFIITPPFSEIIQSIYIFVYTNIGFNYACSISTEKPRKPYGSGVSYVWTQWCHSTPILTYTQCCTSTSHCSLLIRNYSMIVATRPDPTVLPPSRYQTGVLRCANGDFSCDLCEKIRISRCVHMVFKDFVIMVLSLF